MKRLSMFVGAVAMWLATSVAWGQVGSQGALLVVTKQTHALAIVDGASLSVVARVPIGEDPHEVVVGPDGRTAYVSNYGEGKLHTLAAVDLVGERALPPVDVAPLLGPHGLWVHGGRIWFTAEGSKALGTLDPAKRRVQSVLGTGEDMTHLVWVSRDGRKVVASNPGSGTMSFFNAVVAGTDVVGRAPAPPASSTAWSWKQTLITVGPAAEGFAVSPDEREVWVGDSDGVLWIIDASSEKVVGKLNPEVRGANRLKFTPDGSRVLITTNHGKDLVVMDAGTRALEKRIAIEERGASGIEIQPDGTRAFVACPRDHFVAVIDLEKLEVIARIDAGREPDGLAWWSGTPGR